VIQGQYGPQFSSAQRRRLLRFMGRNGFNAYVHAPKDDPYQRTLWRDPYPSARQAAFAAEVRLAARLGIEWIPNVSPAAPAFSSPGEAAPPGTSPSPPICFGRDSELQTLIAKLEPFQRSGVNTFMVSFDDVRRTLSCPPDLAAYGSGERAFGAANGDLLSRLHERLLARDPSARLLTVASDYSGTSDSEYLHGLRSRLSPGVEVMWTGTSIESRPFSATQADSYGRAVGRTPIVWENWTTNDLLGSPARPARVFLGPYSRRPDVVGHVKGFFFNPANQADLNFLPLATAADWMRAPAGYRPRRAFLAQTRRLAGREAAALRAFAEASYSSTLRASVEAPTLRRHIERFLRARKGRGGGARQADRLRRQLRLAATARRRLLRVEGLAPFVSQARPFLRSARLNARVGLLATELLQARGVGERERLRRGLQRARRRAARWPSETFGTRTGVYGLSGNVIDSYVLRVRIRDRLRLQSSRRDRR
jgi:hyaluronoglucosaminidase